MARKIIFLLTFILFCLSPNKAQILYQDQGYIPESNQLSWTQAGLIGERQYYADHLLDVTQFGATKNNNSDDDAVGINNAIAQAKTMDGLTIIYFPEGSYLIKSPILIDASTAGNGNLVFQGDGADKTFLTFELNNSNLDCFYLKGIQIGSDDNGYIGLTQDIPKDSKGLHANDFSSISDNSWIRLSEFDFDVYDSWAEGCVGQITKIHVMDPDYAEMEDPASKTYLASNDLRIWQIEPVSNIGFEDFKLIRDDGKSTDKEHGHNIKMEYVVNCWIRGVEFSNTSRNHVDIKYSSHIEISGCYFHHAESYGGGGYGYGVKLERSTTNCLVENNIFYYLRHAMLVQAGANCNVFEFNYSRDQHWTGENLITHGPDLCLHGNYPYGNLFEYNFVEQITADDAHGENGENNAFVRNRVHFEGEGSDEAISLYSARTTAVLGCQLGPYDQPPYTPIVLKGNASKSKDLYGKYQCQVDEDRTHLDVYQDDSREDCCNQDISYYYSEPPYFLGGFYFPSIGPKPASGDPYPPQSNPARSRYDNNPKTYIAFKTKTPKYVPVDQKDADLSSFGFVFHWEKVDTSYSWQDQPAPHTYEFGLYSDQVIKAEQGLHNNAEKFNNWNNNDYVLNHNTFNIQPDLEGITAYFKSVNNVYLKAELGNYSSYNTVKLKDPWYRDLDEQPYGLRNQGMSAPYLEIPEPYQIKVNSERQGVFLDQGYSQGDWTPPYYEVKADAQQTFSAHDENITGYFLNWDGTQVDFQYPDAQETPVVFHAENAEARAVYKGHLASSIARATGYNNSRRLFKNANILNLAYEDNGDIWYTFSTSDGENWRKEEKINTNANCREPAIAVYGDPDDQYIYVVYIEDYTQNGQNYSRVVCNIKHLSSNTRYVVKDNLLNASSPSVAITPEGYFHISFTGKESGSSQYKIFSLPGYQSNFYTNSFSSFNCASGSKVSLDMRRVYPNVYVYFVWAENGNIKYRKRYYSPSYWNWSSVYTISNNTPPFFYNHQNPTLVVGNNGHGHVSWECEDDMELSKKILYQEYDFNSGANPVSGTLTTIASNDIGQIVRYPSIAYDISNSVITVFYEYLGNIYRKKKSGGNWYVHNYGQGKYPGIAKDVQTGAIWTTCTSAPYLLKTENLNNWLAKSAIAEVESFKRFYYPKTDSNYFTVDLKDFKADGQPLTFYQNLNSDTIKVKGLTNFEYQLEIGENIEAGDLFSFWFVTGDQKYFLDEVKLDGSEAQTLLQGSFSFDFGKKTEGYVQIEFKEKQPFVINVVPDDGSVNLAKSVATQSTLFVPQKFDLKQNFPNPFNPTTQISFDLPLDARITLQVFDLSGHQVATLAQGFRSAGRYSVVFDGRNLASGIYIYRLTTDKGFAQSRKMMLIK